SGLAACLMPGAALSGWWAELPLPSSWGTGLAPATPLGALCLAALAIALACSGPARRFTEQVLAFAIGLAGTAVAAVNLALAVFGVELGTASETMPAATALGLVLAGAALALTHLGRYYLAPPLLARLPAVIALFFLIAS